MEDKKLRFEFYRYQISPVKSINLTLFDNAISESELKQKKNSIFQVNILDQERLEMTYRRGYVQKKFFNYGDVTISKLYAKKHVKTRTLSDGIEMHPDYPSTFLIFNNDPQSQIVLIGHNYSISDDSTSIGNALEKIYRRMLKKFNLTFDLNPILEEDSIWEVLNSYSGRIYSLRFDIIKPNITSISESLRKSIGDLTDSTNSNKTRIELNANKEEVLEGIDKSNEVINVLNEYVTEGGGNVSFKARGLKNRVKTKDKVKTKSIDDLEYVGSPDALKKILKSIFNENGQ